MTHQLTRPTTLVLAVCGALLAAPVAPVEADDDGSIRVMGRVVSAQGEAYAESGDGSLRQLKCDDLVYEGDHIETRANSALGISAGDFYARLNENTALELQSTSQGAPDVRLASGHLRLIDSGAATGDRARIQTPGLVAEDAGTDTEAFAFPEKAWIVSMMCPLGGPLELSRLLPPVDGAAGEGSLPETLSCPMGRCLVGKPNEALFLADATHPRLAVLEDDACALPPVLAAVDLFTPTHVSLGPPPGSNLAFGPPQPLDRQALGASCALISCVQAPSLPPPVTPPVTPGGPGPP